MSKRSAAASRANPYERVTQRIIEHLEAGVVPWRQPWRNVAGGNIPRNALTSRPYSGINRIVTSISGYGDPRWLTYKQARSAGGHVRKGEHGTPILYWNITERERDDGEKVRRGFARVYTLFNVEQCGALTLPEERVSEPRHVYHPVAADIIDGYDGPTFDHDGGSRAYYVPKLDAVHLPRPEVFRDADAYYSVAFHELSHSTGHPSRLDRDGFAESAPFGSPVYSREELIAEFGAAFLCQHAGIDGTTVDRSASYVAHWLGVLKADRRLAVTAASKAQKAADLILGVGAAQAETQRIAVKEIAA